MSALIPHNLIISDNLFSPKKPQTGYGPPGYSYEPPKQYKPTYAITQTPMYGSHYDSYGPPLSSMMSNDLAPPPLAPMISNDLGMEFVTTENGLFVIDPPPNLTTANGAVKPSVMCGGKGGLVTAAGTTSKTVCSKYF